MGQALLSGSALAAFLAGVVAFFAPCCAFVMLPTYLASVTGANRWRTAALTAVFIGGVATIVWPLTIGAAGLSSVISEQHELLFVLGGSVMVAAGIGTLGGWMWHGAPAAGGGDPSGVLGIYTMGLFAGAATACCAPVLAGAVAIAGVSGAWWAGALLGFFYLFGLVTPLLAAAFGVGRIRDRLRDPSIAVLGLRTTLMRFVGGVSFIVLGALLVVLALTGNSRSAPGAQRSLGRWLSARANELVDAIPSTVGWVLVVALVAGVVVMSFRALRVHPVSQESGPR